IPRIAHRRIEEAVDEQRAGGLVDLVFDGLAAKRHLDDDVEVVGRVLADGNGVDVHGGLRGRGPPFRPEGPASASLQRFAIWLRRMVRWRAETPISSAMRHTMLSSSSWFCLSANTTCHIILTISMRWDSSRCASAEVKW